MTSIHIVDDDRGLLHALAINLRARGYDVVLSADGSSALKAIAATSPDLVVVDLGLPDMDGVDVVRGLRAWFTSPIIVLSAREAQADKVRALDAGADDYVTKPFGMDEFVARIRAAIRRASRPAVTESVITTPSLRIDLAARQVLRNSDEVMLTPTEWHMLEILVRHPGQLISQAQLLSEVWGDGYSNQSNYLRVYIARLRRKLENDPARPQHLITVAGSGYRFDA